VHDDGRGSCKSRLFKPKRGGGHQYRNDETVGKASAYIRSCSSTRLPHFSQTGRWKMFCKSE
jgi:hypothetical protein